MQGVLTPDWLNDFVIRLDYPEIKRLKEQKFHGKIEINFHEGFPASYNLIMSRKVRPTI